MKLFRTMTKAVCGASIALTPVTLMAADGVDGNTGTVSSAPAVNSSAKDTAKKNKSGEAFNYIASATEFAIAAQNWARCPHDGSACAVAAAFTIMGIKSMQQAKEDGKIAGQAYQTAAQSDAYGTGDYNSGSGLSSDPDYQAAAAVGSDYMKKAEAGLGELKSQGLVSSDLKTVTAPDGSKYSTADSSPAGLASAGLPKGAIDSAMATSAQIEKKALEKIKIGSATKVNGFEEGGGLGSGSGRSPGSDGPPSYPGYAAGKSGSLLDKDPSRLAAGMTKNYNGEPIGVASDSIFLMMSRRYKVKESQDSFFGNADIELKK